MNKIRGFYYNSQRGEKGWGKGKTFWPLDEPSRQSLKNIILKPMEISL